MAAGAAPNLDQGPPLPPGLQPAQQPSMAQLTGQPQTPQQGSASLQAAVISKLMFVEQTLNDVATMMPAAAGPVSSLIDAMRKSMGGLLSQGATPPAAQGPNIGMMSSPTGGSGGAPTS
jgi:hypothetical protein